MKLVFETMNPILTTVFIFICILLLYFIDPFCSFTTCGLPCLQSIDIENEKINLECAENVPQPEFGRKIPADQARYHLVNFRHTHEGDFLESIGACQVSS